MNPWLRRLHLVLTIGGGFAGLAVAFTTMGESFRQSLPDGFLIIGAALYFLCAVAVAVAVAVGVRLADGTESRTSLLWLYGVQVPLLSSPVVAYHLSLGAHIYVGVLGDSFYWNLQFGDHYSVSLGNGDLSWGFGVNLFALGMYLITSRTMPSNNRFERSRVGAASVGQ
jgi:lysylphosphatidylglycerol synthetase-like protein (DUF2156 family)